MPYIDIDIDIDEILSNCSQSDIKYIIKCLIDDGYLTPDRDVDFKEKTYSYVEQEHIDNCKKIMTSYQRLSNDDTDKIKEIADKL